MVRTEFHEVKERGLLKVSGIIDSHGAAVAFPTTTVHVPDQLTRLQAAVAGRHRNADLAARIE